MRRTVGLPLCAAAVIVAAVALTVLWFLDEADRRGPAKAADRHAVVRVDGHVTHVSSIPIVSSGSRPGQTGHRLVTGFDVQWYDNHGVGHLQRFGALLGPRVAVGERFPVRYDPAHPDRAYPADPNTSGKTDVPFVVALLGLALGVPPLVLWCVRLTRWLLGVRGEVGGASARVRVAAAAWVELRDDNGQKRYQRVIWRPWMAGWRGRQPATIRRCPGPGEMYIVDTDRHGRLWPAGAAAEHRPRGLTSVTGGRRNRRGAAVTYGLGALVAAAYGLLTRSVFGALYGAVLLFAYWEWFAVTPPGWLWGAPVRSAAGRAGRPAVGGDRGPTVG